MHYSSFRIKNFKGIKDTTIKLAEQQRMGVFAFVGLNESGKTTILEAIHSFAPDYATSQLVGGEGLSGVPMRDRVPRHLISSFTGDVSVTAKVNFDEGDKEELNEILKSEFGITVNNDSYPEAILLERHQRFKNGDFVKSYFSFRASLEIKTGKQRKWRPPTQEEKENIRDEIFNRTPNIAYFPTFVFDFPNRIFLTKERGDKVSRFYRGVFQDILDYDGQGHTIEESIIRRIRDDEKIVPWASFFTLWNTGDDKDKIQHVIDRASSIVTKVVFGRWNEIFGEDVKGKEIQISFEPLQGERRDRSGSVSETDEHDLFIKFQIKDSTRRFDVNDRSLGFRWFFSFMLFTQFRVARENAPPMLFLFDEPASNLHAAAQQKLIESFPEIARDGNTLAYTTHSHYMIEPKWLEQTFIVTNISDAPDTSVLDALSLDDESLDIQATRYRAFVNQHPNQTSYFQPILDRLKVIPSRFDIDRSSVVVEGKSDYYILRYAIRLLNTTDLPLVPGLGASTFGALVALDIGWNLNMQFLLDGDEKGNKEKERYMKEYGLPENSISTLNELLDGVKVIEDLLDDQSLAVISAELELTQTPTKNQIRRFFQEKLASEKIIPLSNDFSNKTKSILENLRTRLSE